MLLLLLRCLPSPGQRAESPGRCFLLGFCTSASPEQQRGVVAASRESSPLSPLAHEARLLPASVVNTEPAPGWHCQALPSAMPELLSQRSRTHGHGTGAQHMRSGAAGAALADMHLQLAACSGSCCSRCQSCSLWERRLPSEMGRECARSSGSTRSCSGPETARAVQCPACPSCREGELGLESSAGSGAAGQGQPRSSEPVSLCEPPARPALPVWQPLHGHLGTARRENSRSRAVPSRVGCGKQSRGEELAFEGSHLSVSDLFTSRL